jgi:uncharacterized membrane protein (DUF2068 family)
LRLQMRVELIGMTDSLDPGEKSGLRTIAILEGAKTALILLTGFGLLSLIHRDVEAIAAELVRYLHLNPASKYPKIFIAATRQLTDARLWALAAIAFADAIIRGVESYGLWRGRAWAKWLGVVSGVIYIPFEIYEMIEHVNTLKIATFVINLLIVAYLAHLIRIHHRPKPSAMT